ncbi:MAG: HlyD family efflux transporter periplasmic adaptor subunit, partial [Gammaproteobacteria bacterium]
AGRDCRMPLLMFSLALRTTKTTPGLIATGDYPPSLCSPWRAASVKQLKMERQEAASERDRSIELFEQTLLSDHELKLAKIAYGKTEVALLEVRAELAEVQQQINFTELKAPYAARVLIVHAYPGQAISSEAGITSLVTLVRSGKMQLQVELDSKQIARIRIDQSIDVLVNGKTLQGSIATMESSQAIIVFDAPADLHLFAGQSASISLP